MSQEFLAEESRLSLRTIQRIENEESEPVGETIKRIAIALDVSLEELVDSTKNSETIDLKGTLIFFKRLLSKATEKSEVQTFQKFINILTDLKSKDLTEKQLYIIESYIQYLELEKIPSYSHELYQQKLKKFKKHLTLKLQFVPNNYYSIIGFAISIPFLVAFLSNSSVSIAVKITVSVLAIILIVLMMYLDRKIKRQGRNLRFS